MKRRHAATPLADALARVGDRWTLLVVAALLEGPKRFNELQDELDGIAPNVLSSRLKALTEQTLIKHCRESLTGYKVPKRVYFRDELPKTNVGKILRRALRDELGHPPAPHAASVASDVSTSSG